MSTNSTTFNFCKQHVQNLHVLDSLDSWDLGDSFLLWEPPLPMVLHLHRFPSRHLHVAPQLVQCHNQQGPDPCSEFSLDLRARCSAILVSRLLRIVHNVGFCWLHFFAQIEIGDVVFDVNWIEPPHQSFGWHPQFLANFALRWNYETTDGSQTEILVSFTCDFSQTNCLTRPTVRGGCQQRKEPSHHPHRRRNCMPWRTAC